MTAYLSALVVCATSVVLGAAICRRADAWSWTSPSVGLSAVILIALGAVRLPGHGTTAAVAIGIASIASLVYLSRRGTGDRSALLGLPIAVAVLVFCSLAFIANERIGELGARMNDDLAIHMGQADALRTLGAEADVTTPGYPNGPHATVAALAEGIGVGVSDGFTGLLLAIPVLTALTALAALERGRWYLRALAAALTAVPYLAVSYLAQGAFKEPLLGLMFLGFVLTLREARASRQFSIRAAVALLLTAAAGVAVFGVTALAWPAAALLWLGALEVATGRRPKLRDWKARWWALASAGAVVACGVAIALFAGSSDFFETGPGKYITESEPGGNFLGQLSPLEAFGVWRHPDFRFTPANSWLHEPGLVFALGVVLFGLTWCWRRRDWALLAGALGGLSIYAVARPVTLAYFSGKALAVVAPVLTLIALRALVAVTSTARAKAGKRAVAAVALAAYVLLAGSSSALALRGAHVRPTERGPDLAAFRDIVEGEPTLYLGRDNYAPWELRGAELGGYQTYPSGLAGRLPEGKGQAGDADPPAVDVDSLDYRFLDGFRYLVTPRTDHASVPPPNFRPVSRSTWHVLWQRRGPTQPRSILDEGEAPGKLLDCRRGPGRRLARTPGVAYVRPEPVIGVAGDWRTPGGDVRSGVVRNGETRVQRLELEPGTWDISLRYYSDVPLLFRAGRHVRSLPPYVADESTFFSAGRIVSRGGPLTVTVHVPQRRRVEIERTVRLGTVAATRIDVPGRLVPLAEACGSYVDWFRTRGSRPD